MECAGPCRRHSEVRRHAPIWIDLYRRKRQNGLFDGGRRRTLERRIEEPRVRRHLLDVAIGRDNHERQRTSRPRCVNSRQRLARWSEPGCDWCTAECRQHCTLPEQRPQ